jgi:endonuclease-3
MKPAKHGAVFPIGRVLSDLLRRAPSWNAPVDTFGNAERGDPFRVLVACILSLRTKDQVTGPAAERLFAIADTPAALSRIAPRRIERAIYPVGFYRTKARVLRQLSADLVERCGASVPADIEALLSLKGVGRKTANLVLSQGFAKPAICVDTHVHRISNRWGYIRTKNPDQTEAALRARLPRKFWIGYNGLLVAFGQTICKPVSPLCTSCPVSGHCPRVGVTRHR